MAFQSPAANFAKQRISFGDIVHLSPHSTYIMRSAGDYPDAGIVKGSLLAVERGLIPKHQQVVIAEVDNELVIRRLLLTPASALQELSGDCPITHFKGGNLPIWGVVAYSLTDLAGLGFKEI
ncbi:peptidase [Pantoea agglomerans]|uniref:S24 family peptidase n=1 Tax=Enterobacter agglomerans TaxID=549 RepID=UPI00202D5E0C|nr:S24 family peptidase [Pantoea agglomerans]MCL6413254.1 peptidase [Pantoea agglomerans]